MQHRTATCSLADQSAGFRVDARGAIQARGYALVMVLIVLAIVSVLGVAGMRLSMLAERGARNDRDHQLAWQAAEAALLDAEADISRPGTSRHAIFSDPVQVDAFEDHCASTTEHAGLCAPAATGKPAWSQVDFEETGGSARTAEYGRYSGQHFPAGKVGVQPSKAPRYVVELIKDPDDINAATCSEECLYVYRITAMGFGPRPDVQAVLQVLYRI
ncbi:MAG: PilX N-terminal domain-containing pilus assembly protein [Polaromonas sp.]|nr:PilX N-terminal domain-containing pilus assembly protein [Polaromonas sp.]